MCINKTGSREAVRRLNPERSGHGFSYGYRTAYPSRVRSSILASQYGISLIELVMFIVIVSVAMAGIMLVINTNTQYSADPLIRKQALTVAASLLEEIESRVFSPGGFAGPYTQANRASFDDIMDYNGFSTTGAYPASGVTAVTGLESYNVSVVVLKPLAANWGNISAASAARITVTVTDPIGQTVEAIGYKVDY